MSHLKNKVARRTARLTSVLLAVLMILTVAPIIAFPHRQQMEVAILCVYSILIADESIFRSMLSKRSLTNLRQTIIRIFSLRSEMKDFALF